MQYQDSESFFSLSNFSQGKIEVTIVGGRVVWENNELKSKYKRTKYKYIQQHQMTQIHYFKIQIPKGTTTQHILIISNKHILILVRSTNRDAHILTDCQLSSVAKIFLISTDH